MELAGRVRGRDHKLSSAIFFTERLQNVPFFFFTSAKRRMDLKNVSETMLVQFKLCVQLACS